MHMRPCVAETLSEQDRVTIGHAGLDNVGVPATQGEEDLLNPSGVELRA